MDWYAVFSKVLNMSLTGSLVILCVLAVRLALRRAPKIYSYCLWSVVLFRLLCPVSISAGVSVLEVVKAPVTQSQGITSSVSYLPYDTSVQDAIPSDRQETEIVEIPHPITNSELEAISEPAALDPASIASTVWLAGLAVMACYSLIMYLRLRWKLVGAAVWKGNIYIADHIDSPFVMGLIFPKIYLPSYLSRSERRYIVAHERHHIKRCDHIIKLLAFGALCIHWFNPLVWVAFVQAGKDMEMSCDEAVIKRLGPQIRADYSASLLRLATDYRIIAGTPLAFGEGDTKGRVMNMAKWRKPKLWVSIVCLLLCAAVLVACAVNPSVDESTETALYAGAEDFPFEIGQLPEGYSYEFDENQNVIFTNGTNTVGGINAYPIPEGVYDPDDEIFLWLEEVGIPDFEDSSLCYMGGITATGGGWAAEFASDVPEGVEPSEQRRHHFYPIGDDVYDIWFDMMLISYQDSEEIRPAVKRITTEQVPNTVAYETTMPSAVNELKPVIDGGEIVTNLELVTYGALNVVFPDGYESREEDGAIILTANGQDIGGITCYSTPDFALEIPDNMAEWVQALGLPEAQDNQPEPIAYLISGSRYGDLQAEYFNELDSEKLNVEHHFFIDGNLVYDIYYDQNVISDAQAEKFLKTIQLNGNPASEELTKEEAAFKKCRAVFDVVQNGSHQIYREKKNQGNQGPSGYVTTYCYDNGDWLSITEMVLEGTNQTDSGEYYNRQAYMYAHDTAYSNEGHWGDRVEIIWSEGGSDIWTPKLASFYWVKANISYVDTIEDEQGECIMFRIDRKFVDHDDYTDFYFANFRFDSEGNFVNVEFQVNLFQDNAFTVTESIVSLDSETVRAEIEKEYQRANG